MELYCLVLQQLCILKHICQQKLRMNIFAISRILIDILFLWYCYPFYKQLFLYLAISASLDHDSFQNEQMYNSFELYFALIVWQHTLSASVYLSSAQWMIKENTVLTQKRNERCIISNYDRILAVRFVNS